jgi:hypothetical protein
MAISQISAINFTRVIQYRQDLARIKCFCHHLKAAKRLDKNRLKSCLRNAAWHHKPRWSVTTFTKPHLLHSACLAGAMGDATLTWHSRPMDSRYNSTCESEMLHFGQPN